MSEHLETATWTQRHLGTLKLIGLIVSIGVSIYLTSLLHLLVELHAEEVTPEVIASLLAFVALVWLLSLTAMLYDESLNEVAQAVCISIASGTAMFSLVVVMQQIYGAQ